MIMKKILSFLHILVMILLLCSCNSEYGEKSYNETVQEVTQTQSVAETTQPTTISEKDITDEKIENILSLMSIEEKVGQMFYVRCPETEAIETIAKYHLGGYILFGRDFDGKTREEITTEINSYQSASDIPMLIGVDEEGGTVVRVSSNPMLREEPFLSPSDTYYNGGWNEVKSSENEKADLLLSLGINVNMAPVCDITSEPDAFMYYRSFSEFTDNQSEYVKTVVDICKDKKLGTVLKHFPGYGNNADTHTGIAYDNREYSEFTEKDFLSFEEGIKEGADCVLIAHNMVICMDNKYPASLSKHVHDILRSQLNFDGVIMTDDLSMDAITQYTGADSAAVFAAKNGNDILCCTDVDIQYPAVLDAVKNGEISIDQIDMSVRRILRWKYNLGLLT